MRGRGPRCLDRTIAGHDLPHTDVRDGDAALSGAENGLEGLRKVLGFFFFFSQEGVAKSLLVFFLGFLSED